MGLFTGLIKGLITGLDRIGDRGSGDIEIGLPSRRGESLLLLDDSLSR